MLTDMIYALAFVALAVGIDMLPEGEKAQT